MDNSYIKKYLVLLVLWSGFVYLTIELVYVIYLMLPIQIFLGLLSSKFIAQKNLIKILALITIVIPISAIATYIPDSSNGLILVYFWYSSLAFVAGIAIWAIFVKIKNLTRRSSGTREKASRAP